jgi:hypothetical protein
MSPNFIAKRMDQCAKDYTPNDTIERQNQSQRVPLPIQRFHEPERWMQEKSKNIKQHRV